MAERQRLSMNPSPKDIRQQRWMSIIALCNPALRSRHTVQGDLRATQAGRSASVGTWTAVALPSWPIPGLLVIWPVVVGLRSLRSMRRRRANLCVACAFDLRGSVSSCCAECGASIEPMRRVHPANPGRLAPALRVGLATTGTLTLFLLLLSLIAEPRWDSGSSRRSVWCAQLEPGYLLCGRMLLQGDPNWSSRPSDSKLERLQDQEDRRFSIRFYLDLLSFRYDSAAATRAGLLAHLLRESSVVGRIERGSHGGVVDGGQAAFMATARAAPGLAGFCVDRSPTVSRAQGVCVETSGGGTHRLMPTLARQRLAERMSVNAQNSIVDHGRLGIRLSSDTSDQLHATSEERC
jgi:hypothetical protein